MDDFTVVFTILVLLWVIVTQRDINRLKWKVCQMATQAEVNEIVSTLQTVKVEVEGIAEDVQTLKDKIDELQANTPEDVDLSELQELASTLVDRVTALNGETPEEPADPELED